MDDLSVILLGAAAIGAVVVLGTNKRRKTMGAMPAALVRAAQSPPTGLAGGAITGTAQGPPSLKTQVLRGMSYADRLPTIRQRMDARRIARNNMREFCLRYPEECCGKVGDPGGYGLMGFV